MDKNSLRSIAIVGQLATLAGIGRHGVNNFLDSLMRRKRKGQQHPGTYRGCPKDKFASMTRQRRRAEALKTITAEVKASFQLPRRVMRAIVRTRVNREWRTV